MIRFQKINDISAVSDYLAERIRQELIDGNSVLWLVPGGSAMEAALKTAGLLAGCKNLDKLFVSLTDERFGGVGHDDSNWKQLQDKGFSLSGAQLIPVLRGKSMPETAREYSDFLNRTIDTCGYGVALAGMGPDGHIFGIKPGSPAVSSQEEVAAYDWEDFRRLTPTLRLLKKLDEVVIYAAGEEKHKQLDMLEKELPPQEQPAQQLKELKKVIIFNDYKGDAV